MLSMILVAFLPLFACRSADEPHVAQVKFGGTVQNLVMLSGYSGKVISVDFDPRYVVAIRIEEADIKRGVFGGAATEAFAIHSPTEFFGLLAPTGEIEKVIGRAFDFSIIRMSSAKGNTYEKLKCIGAR